MAYIDNWSKLEKELKKFGLYNCIEDFHNLPKGVKLLFDTKGPNIQSKVRWIMYSLLHHLGVKDLYKIRSIPGEILVSQGGEAEKTISVSQQINWKYYAEHSIMPTEETKLDELQLLAELGNKEAESQFYELMEERRIRREGGE